jgi:hypothetical protein
VFTPALIVQLLVDLAAHDDRFETGALVCSVHGARAGQSCWTRWSGVGGSRPDALCRTPHRRGLHSRRTPPSRRNLA